MALFHNETKVTPSWQLIQPNLQLVRENIWSIIYLSFLPSLVATTGLVLLGIDRLANRHYVYHWTGREVTGLGLLMVALIGTFLAYPAVCLLQVKAIRGEHLSVLQAFTGGIRKLFPLLGASLLGGIVTAFGILCFIFPGIILMRGFFLASFYVVDQNLGPVEALKHSYADSKQNAGWIWGTIGVGVVIVLSGSILQKIPVIGYILSIISSYFYFFVPALRYREVTAPAKQVLEVMPKTKKAAKRKKS